jgi:hypothetical protein
VQEQSRNETGLFVEAALSISYPRKRTNFKATFELTSQLTAVTSNGKQEKNSGKLDFTQIPDTVPTKVSGLDQLKELSDSAESIPTVEEIYSQYLFHGPLFQHITAVEALGTDGIVGKLKASKPNACILNNQGQPWSIDPVLLDSAMQITGVWVRKFLDITTLPTGFRKLHILQPLSFENYYVRAFMDTQVTATNLACHVALYNEDGHLVLLLESLGGVGSKSLNRLASPGAPTGLNR